MSYFNDDGDNFRPRFRPPRQTPSSSTDNSKRSYKHKKVQTFSSYIYAVLKQFKDDKEDASIGKKSMAVMNSFIRDTFERLMKEVINVLRHDKKKLIQTADMRAAVNLLLPSELAKHAIIEGMRAIGRFNSVTDSSETIKLKALRDKKINKRKVKSKSSKTTMPKSIKAGLLFPVGRIRSHMKANKELASGVGIKAAIFTTAVLEYLTYEILDLVAKKNRRITCRDLKLAIVNDQDLLALLKEAIIPGAGVLENIHKILLPKKSAEAKPAVSKKSGTKKSGSKKSGSKKKTPETEPIVEKVMDAVSAESLQNPAQNAQIVSALEVAAESASSKQAAAIEAAITSIEQITGSSSDKQAERVADAVVDVLATVVSPPKAKSKTPGNRLLKEIEASKGLVQTPARRRR